MYETIEQEIDSAVMSMVKDKLLRMDGFQHHGNRFHLVTWCNREDISVKMDCASLIADIREHFRYSLQHTEILVPYNQANTG